MASGSSKSLSQFKNDDSAPLLGTEGGQRHSYIPYVPYICILNAGICGSYYAVTTILDVYLQSALGLSKSLAGSITSLFFFGTYTFALVGGIVADTWLGSFRVLVVGAFTMITGCLVLICNELLYRYDRDIHVPLGLVGLVLVYLGNGFLKPCLSAFLGDQFNEDEDDKRSQWFSWFYLTIQVGSLIFSIATPITLSLLPNHKYITFLLALAPLLIGFSIFIIPHDNYKKKDPVGAVLINFLSIIGAGCCGRRSPRDNHWLDKAKNRFPETDVEDAKISLRVFLVLVPLPFFWMVFFQMYSIWIDQAQGMDTQLGSVTIPYAESSVLNGLLDLFIIPIFSKLVYPLFDFLTAAFGFPKFTLLKRIAAGHIFTIAALCVAGFITYKMNILEAANPDNPEQLGIALIVPQYILISCAEILLSISAIEFSYQEAPLTMKGIVTAVFQCTTAIGNALISALAQIQSPLWITNFTLAGIILVVFFIFTMIAHNYKYRTASSSSIQ